MENKIYNIWKIHKTVEYPLYKILDIVNYSRSDVRNMDYNRVKDFCDYLNEMSDIDFFYEIRYEEYYGN